MGNYNFRTQTTFANKQLVHIVGSKFSNENVTEEIKTLGKGAYVVQSTKLHQSRPSAPTIYITRVQFPKTKKYETFLSTDLKAIK
jgi:hypothetical protein